MYSTYILPKCENRFHLNLITRAVESLPMKGELNIGSHFFFMFYISNTIILVELTSVYLTTMALIKCSECGNMISDKSESCVHCGAPMELKENLIPCPECSALIEDTAEKCTKCGFPLTPKKKLECPECGKKVDEGTAECPECGFPFISPKAPIICPECGKEVNEQSKNCPECGCPLETNENQESLLINCKACGKSISKWADICPHCGQISDNKIEEEFTNNSIDIIVGFLQVAVVAVGFFFILRGCSN